MTYLEILSYARKGIQAEIDKHRAHGEKSGEWENRRLKRAASEVEALVLGTVRQKFAVRGRDAFVQVAAAVRDGDLDPYAASDQILSSI